MRREFAVSVYLFCFKLIFNFFKRKPLEDKTVFVASFGGNVDATIDALDNIVEHHPIIILNAANDKLLFTNRPNRTIIPFEVKRLRDYMTSIYHLATSRYIFVDNYYGFLAVSDFKPEVKCVQLWHAAGAIKQFGLEDLSNKHRTDKAMERFRAVYNRFDYVTVGSESMIDIFKGSFGLPKERFIRTGIPRTDFFFNERKQREAQEVLLEDFPLIKERKTIMYAPTYRDNELATANLQLDLDEMYRHFKHDYILFLRLHPTVNYDFENKYPGFIYNVTNYDEINHLLIGTDILITDYSSIPFEFSLLNRPMIFYAYDLDTYKDERGLWDNYEEQVPGPVVKNTMEIIHVIENKDYELHLVQPFADEWNRYSNGQSSTNLIQTIYEVEVATEKIREHV